MMKRILLALLLLAAPLVGCAANVPPWIANAVLGTR
jgi:hypothetical protein